ncbi:histidine kinase group [Trichoderma cornu-damae]|uniref:Histidine kinase group n=1 Tax=Trichoderma cornu-damae TaxID=654480 RepID=A0A9P8QTX7_9HYPO|nr:histidine kinase group [Trichoderma cornu-damae]
MNGSNERAGLSNGSQANSSNLHQLAEDIRQRALEETEHSKDDAWTQNSRDSKLEGIGIDLTGVEEIFDQHGAGTGGDEKAEMDAEMDADHIDILRGINRISIEEVEINGMTMKKFKFDDLDVETYFGNADPYETPKEPKGSIEYTGRDLISGICQHVELAVELGKHLNGKDIMNLCLANRPFYNALNGYLLSSIRTWIEYRAPEAGRIFHYQLYAKHLVDDPQKRTWMALKQGKTTSPNKDSKIRKVPGLKYLQLVLGRDKYCGEILALMARCGHRMPSTMHHSLLRLWLLMDISTSRQRQAMLRMTHLFKDVDLYNMQMFFIKLGMLFNDPVYGPCKFDLVQLMLGQKGLHKLWQLLTRKKFYKLPEILELKLRYDFTFFSEGSYWLENMLGHIQGIPFQEIGQQHKEGWGAGRMHLLRPDEVIPIEAVRRGLHLDDHLSHMVIWGYFDWKTGENIVPSLEEMYIEDEDDVLANVDTLEHWKPRHVLKKRWSELTPEQQDEILSDEEDERLRAQAWGGGPEDDAGSLDGLSESDDDESLNLDEEINRGYIVPPQPRDHESTVPDVDNMQGWVNFVNQSVLGGMIPDLGEDEKLRAQAWSSYPDNDAEGGWDWNEPAGEVRDRRRPQRQWDVGGADPASEPQNQDGSGDGAEDDHDNDNDDDGDEEGDIEDNNDEEEGGDHKGNLDGGNMDGVYQAGESQSQSSSSTETPHHSSRHPDSTAVPDGRDTEGEMDIDPQSLVPIPPGNPHSDDHRSVHGGEDEIMRDWDEN